MHRFKRVALAAVLLTLAAAGRGFAQEPALTQGAAGGQNWSTETLSNGLRVIYAPMPNSPTSHIRVLYHVGSRDEQSNRQGFAHMFEHMMFRGSAHVAPQEHGKLVSLVGGIANAFTSFDETVYHDTLPASYTEMALWLEADRMSSFKVTDPIFKTERQVVAEEWRMRLNQPYGGLFDQLMPAVFKVHPYHWTPIGNMDHLNAANVGELQSFFNKYYGPNNAILVVAGNIDLDKTRAEVKKYFGWIPARGEHWTFYTPGKTGEGSASDATLLNRQIAQEPPQTEPRRLEVKMTAPLARVMLAYRMPPEASDDTDALELLLNAAGDGRSSRLSRALVTGDHPLCVDAGASAEELQDGGVMVFDGEVLGGKSTADVEKVMREQIAQLRDKPVTPEELEKVKQNERLGLAQRFETAEKTATVLGEEMLVHNNLNRVTTARARMEALTAADLQKMAQKYLQDNTVTTMVITPGTAQEVVSAAAAAQTAPAPAIGTTTAPATAPAMDVKFPADYPTTAPLSGKLPAAVFAQGVSSDLQLPGGGDGPRREPHPVQVIVMEDHSMPIVNWCLTLRRGAYSEPAGKEGVAGITAEMVRRGPKGTTFDQFNEALESRAISLEVADGSVVDWDRTGDSTILQGSCLKEQLPFALTATHDTLLNPAFDPAEFERCKDQALSVFQLSLNDPHTLASRALTHAIYGDSPLGRLATMQSISSLTLDDVKAFYNGTYKSLDGAVLLISGDISVADGQAAARTLLAGAFNGSIPDPVYNFPKPADKPSVILVDRPGSRQAAIEMALPAYSIRSDEKFAGTLANQILSGGGIESRLGQYVRAEKGYVYGVSSVFAPNRQAGTFHGSTDTKFETTADTVLAMYKVFDDMKKDPVTTAELANAKFRVAGSLLMSMQTVQDQADYRIIGILNGYPADYYDKYAERVGQVNADQVKTAMDKYVQEDHMTVVVVGPAETLRPQLEKVGPVQVIPAADAGK